MSGRGGGEWAYLLHYWWWVWLMRYFRTLMWSHLCWWASLSRRHSQLTALNTQDTNSGTHRVTHSPTHSSHIGTLRCDSRVRLMATSFIELRTSCSNFLPSFSGQVFEALPFEKCLTGYKLDRAMRRTDKAGGQVDRQTGVKRGRGKVSTLKLCCKLAAALSRDYFFGVAAATTTSAVHLMAFYW